MKRLSAEVRMLVDEIRRSHYGWRMASWDVGYKLGYRANYSVLKEILTALRENGQAAIATSIQNGALVGSQARADRYTHTIRARDPKRKKRKTTRRRR